MPATLSMLCVEVECGREIRKIDGILDYCCWACLSAKKAGVVLAVDSFLRV